jgi:hypothetical protein
MLPQLTLHSCPFILRATGAGVAALLALHYRQVFPGRVRAWTFAPPGGLLSPGASDSMQDICYSLVTSKVGGREGVAAEKWEVATHTSIRAYALRCRLPAIER